jgi:hypothetical protein
LLHKERSRAERARQADVALTHLRAPDQACSAYVAGAKKSMSSWLTRSASS